MTEGGTFERILESLHAVSLYDAKWPEVSALIDQACGAKGSFLVTGDGDTSEDVNIFFARFCFRGERDKEMERKYFATYHACDERIPRLRELPDSHVVHISSLYTEEEKRTSLVYNEVLPLGHTRDSLNVRLDGPGSSRIAWVVADPVDANGWTSARVNTIKRLLPHLRQFVRVRHALVGARAYNASILELFDRRGLGVIQLDGRARIVEANDAARTILCTGNALLDEGGELRAAQPDDDARLQELLARAVPYFGGVRASGSMVVGREGSWPSLVLNVIPVGGEDAAGGASRIAALVLLTDLSTRMHFDPGQVAALLGLTPAQSDIACLLAEGRTVREIAAARARSQASVRFHLKHIFARHGLSRQVDLVELVHTLADFVPEVRR